jgi:hypothetical protein
LTPRSSTSSSIFVNPRPESRAGESVGILKALSRRPHPPRFSLASQAGEDRARRRLSQVSWGGAGDNLALGYGEGGAGAQGEGRGGRAPRGGARGEGRPRRPTLSGGRRRRGARRAGGGGRDVGPQEHEQWAQHLRPRGTATIRRPPSAGSAARRGRTPGGAVPPRPAAPDEPASPTPEPAQLRAFPAGRPRPGRLRPRPARHDQGAPRGVRRRDPVRAQPMGARRGHEYG